MTSRKLTLIGALTLAMVLLSGGVAFAVSRTAAATTVLQPVMPRIDQANGSARSAGSATSYPMPYPGDGGGGPFQPGFPPFCNQGPSGDGLSTWGVAFKHVSDASTEPDQELIKKAVQDAQKRGGTLAGAAGEKLGKLLAISSFTQNEAYFDKPCGPYPMKGVPVPNGAPEGSSTSIAPAPPTQLPECQPTHYAVAWVLARYQLG